MNASRFPILHRVTVEFIGSRSPLVYDLSSSAEAQRCIETLKRNPEAWHVFHTVQRHYRGKHFVQVSLYRSHESKQWECRFTAPESQVNEEGEDLRAKSNEP